MTQIILFSVLVVCAIGFCYIGLPWIYGKFVRILLKRKAVNNNVLILTFDDGPGSRMTPAVLKLLNEYHAKATFFLLGRNIMDNEYLVRQIAAEGHEVCSHGYDHLHYWKSSPWRSLSDIHKGWKAIDKALGAQHGKYPFRPPYGKINIICLIYLLIRKVQIIHWTLDSGDTWLPKDKRDSYRAALLTKESGGAVVLAHDFDRSDDNSAPFVLELLQRVLAMARETGMQIRTVLQLLNDNKR